MSSFHHDPWQDGTTQFKEDHMNVPLGQLDQVLNEVSGEIQTGVHDFNDKLTLTGSPAEDSDRIVIYSNSSGEYQRRAWSGFQETGQDYGIGIYDMGIALSGSPSNSQVLCTYPMPRSVTFPYDCGTSQAYGGTAATAQTVFSFKKDGVEFATCTFAAAGQTGTFSGEQTAFTAGEVFTLVAPASADATLADIGFAITAVRIT